MVTFCGLKPHRTPIFRRLVKVERAKTFPYCHTKGVGVIVLGDLTGIRNNIKARKKERQKLHQWAFGKITELVTYKAKALGIKVVQIDEAHTSQTCPSCGNRKKPTNRNYICTSCGFTSHRDGVGAINIRRKYRGLLGQHVGAEKVSDRMAPPVYLRISEVPVASS